MRMNETLTLRVSAVTNRAHLIMSFVHTLYEATQVYRIMGLCLLSTKEFQLKTLLAIALVLSTVSTSFACSCVPLSYSDRDVTNAVENFMTKKLNASEVVRMDRRSSAYSMSSLSSVLTTLFPFGDSESRSCDNGCSMRNLTAKYEVLAVIDGSDCVVDLTVKMKENFSGTSFRSIVRSQSVNCH
jgi:hypothetical protein